MFDRGLRREAAIQAVLLAETSVHKSISTSPLLVVAEEAPCPTLPHPAFTPSTRSAGSGSPPGGPCTREPLRLSYLRCTERLPRPRCLAIVSQLSSVMPAGGEGQGIRSREGRHSAAS